MKFPNIDRRTFLSGCALGASAAGGISLIAFTDGQKYWTPRPPGALSGRAFIAACARCGQCVKACPYGTLRLAAPGDPAPIGTPYFTPRDTPCYMCRDVPCVKACPTGALDPALEEISQARMGVAAVDPSSCLSMQGLRCEVCLRACPETGRALTLETHPRGLSRHAVFVPTIHPDSCTGCGLCEKACPTDKPAIRVADPEAVLGEIGRHYRLGWLREDDPKNRHGAQSEADGIKAIDASPAEESAGGLDYLNENIL